MIAIRENAGKEITHSLRIFDGRGEVWAEGSREIAKLVYRAWLDRKSEWTCHED